MNIRIYQQTDLDQILNDMDGRYSKRREDKFRLVELHDAFYCYVAEQENKIVGFIIMEDLGDNKSQYMVQINVGRKREGIGRKLVEKVFEHIGIGGHISLCVNTDNTSAIQFYESLGFRRSGLTEEYRKGQNKYWYNINL